MNCHSRRQPCLAHYIEKGPEGISHVVKIPRLPRPNQLGGDYSVHVDQDSGQQGDPHHSLTGLNHPTDQQVQLAEHFEEPRHPKDPQQPGSSQESNQRRQSLAFLHGQGSHYHRHHPGVHHTDTDNDKVKKVPVPVLRVTEEARAASVNQPQHQLQGEPDEQNKLHPLVTFDMLSFRYVCLHAQQNGIAHDGTPGDCFENTTLHPSQPMRLLHLHRFGPLLQMVLQVRNISVGQLRQLQGGDQVLPRLVRVECFADV
mmetsp:Transcript_15113/g.33332  ORF Transcript_15113/g.33332 Transcript_15113/m.33332 type:complete len:257 (-) Transcript_15113:244-1014(-)